MADVAKENPPVADPKSKRGRRSRGKKNISTDSFPEQGDAGKSGGENSKKRRSRQAGKGQKRDDTSSPERGASICQSAEVTCDSVAIERAVTSNSTKSRRSKKNRSKGDIAVQVKSDSAVIEKSVASNSTSRNSRRNKNRAKGDAQATKASLSQEELAFLKKIQGKSSDSLKTGSISLAELMGKTEKSGSVTLAELMGTKEQNIGSSILQRLIEKPINVKSLLEAAVKERPPVPGFSRGYPNPNYNVRPEVLHTAMEVFRKASQNYQEPHGHDGRFADPAPRRPYQREDFRPQNTGLPHQRDFRLPSVADHLPWVPMTPMYPLGDRLQGPQGSPFRTRNIPPMSYRSFSGHNNANRNGPPMTSSHSIAPSAGQKTRKPFFMLYLSGEYVSRGLASGDFFKGSLRVNQRSYKESSIDNPEGDDQMDLLILGLHDRDRALHGDVVVVRLKDRSNWVVRESLYQAWRTGHLDMSQDDDGKPMTLPPLPSPQNETEIEVSLGGSVEVKMAKRDLDKTVPHNDQFAYNRRDMILMGAQSELSRLGKLTGDDLCLEPQLQDLIESLSLRRVESRVAPPTPSRRAFARRALFQNAKKSSHKTLADTPADDWGVPDFCLQKTAEVVFIAEQRNCRAAMGQLRVMSDANRNYALFCPTDSRMPRMMIPSDQTPIGFFDRPSDFTKFIFVARVVELQATAQFARGRLERSLGLAGDIDAETEGLLFSNDVDTREFSNEALSSLPDAATWSIPEEEVKARLDLRDEAVFSIVDKDSKAIDVAIHATKKDNCWEIGLHVADVEYFVKEGTELDNWVSKRATAVDLVHKKVPMLPRALTENLCSFIEDSDRLAFSAIWEIDNDANILSEKFERSVIRTKANINYDDASFFRFLAGHVGDDIVFGSLHSQGLSEKISALRSIADRLRARREEEGSLSLAKTTLQFKFNQETKIPEEVSLAKKSSGELLMEEFKILADTAVARAIENACPKTALFLRHPSPKQKVLREVEELCEKIGFPLNGASSSTLASSLKTYHDDEKLNSAYKVLCLLLKRPMQAEQFFCVGTQPSPDAYFHYGLNRPL